MSNGENHNHLVGKWVVRGAPYTNKGNKIEIRVKKIEGSWNSFIGYDIGMFNIKGLNGNEVICEDVRGFAYIFDNEEDAEEQAKVLRVLYE